MASEVEKGFNSDIQILGHKLHVQTEDWGPEMSMIVTKVFKNGAVVRSQKTRYDQFLNRWTFDQSIAIQKAMREQHQQILDLLRTDLIK
jgi:hypothetical protein